MSKNFESEYKEYIEKIKPDLWDKISSQLPERSEIQNEQEENVISFQEAAKKKVPFVSKKKKYTRIGGIVAACLCVAILLPFYVNHRQDMMYDSQASAYNTRPGSFMSGSSSDISKVFDHKTENGQLLEAEVLVEKIENGYADLIIISSEDSELVTDSEVSVSIKENEGLTEGSRYQVELSKDKNGKYTLRSFSNLE